MKQFKNFYEGAYAKYILPGVLLQSVLIGGGYDKQSEYDEWIEAFDGKVKELVLIGPYPKPYH